MCRRGTHPTPPDLSPAEAIIDDAVGLVATRHPSMVVRGEIVEWPAPLVLTVASRSADLLVVGARGLGGFEELLIGSVSDQCLQYAHCPVAVVHCDADDIPYRALEPRIVVGIDGSLGSTRALQWALDEAAIRSASVEAVYAWQYPPIGTFVVRPAHGSERSFPEVVEAATEHAERFAPEVPFKAWATCSPTVPALLDACQGADLLVVGSRGHGRFRDACWGRWPTSVPVTPAARWSWPGPGPNSTRWCLRPCAGGRRAGSRGIRTAGMRRADEHAVMEPLPDRYPSELACTVEGRDGALFHLRPIRSDDGDRLAEFHGRLSTQSVYRRFFFVHPRLSAAEIERFTHVDYRTAWPWWPPTATG